MKLPTHLALVLKEFALRIETYLTGDFSAATLEEKQKHCADVRQLAAIAGASLAPIPIPFADIWTITPVQIAMVQAIGNIYGYNLEGKNLKAAFATVAGGWLGQQACLALFKIGMPGAGGFGGAAFVWVWTHAMGRVAEKYFSSGMKLSKEELRKIREEELKNATPPNMNHWLSANVRRFKSFPRTPICATRCQKSRLPEWSRCVRKKVALILAQFAEAMAAQPATAISAMARAG